MKRRDFVKRVSSATLVLLSGRAIKVTAAAADELRENSSLRFAIASDGHYGENGTEFDQHYESLVSHITSFHQENKLAFCVINGDLIHDKKDFLVPTKKHLERLPVKYYVTKGNHDRVSDAFWQEVWGMPVNHEVRIQKNTLLLATTSNEEGEYLSPDLGWMKSRLEANKSQENIFVFIHIPQGKWTKHAVETPAFFDMIRQHKNVSGVFHGHEHAEDGVRMHDNIPYMFDSHFGGSWGTTYRGFRVVELLKEKSFLTYIMNPVEKINQASF
jgi:DNA repair exonuclease SbcCD nuclease subunit